VFFPNQLHFRSHHEVDPLYAAKLGELPLDVSLPRLVMAELKHRWRDMVFILPSGKRLHNYGKSPFLMGKSTIYKWPFSIATLNYQRVYQHGWFGGITPFSGNLQIKDSEALLMLCTTIYIFCIAEYIIRYPNPCEESSHALCDKCRGSVSSGLTEHESVSRIFHVVPWWENVPSGDCTIRMKV